MVNRTAILLSWISLNIVACVPLSTPAARPEPAGGIAEGEATAMATAIATPTSAPSPTPGPGEPRLGGTLVVALDGPVGNLDPANTHDRPTGMVVRNMFDGLTAVTPEGEIVLELASSGQPLDELTWEFELREGVHFHNGDLLTAEDVKFTFARIIQGESVGYPEPHRSPWQKLFAPLARVEVVDANTVRFHLLAPWPSILQALAYQPVLPGDYLEAVGAGGFDAQPVGTGPFRFVNRTAEGGVILARFDDYYGGGADRLSAGPALLDGVIFRVIPDDAERVAALRAGEVDIIQTLPIKAVPEILDYIDVSALPVSACGGIYTSTGETQKPRFAVGTAPGLRYYWLEMNVTRPPFDDVRVRQALNYAVNIEWVLQKQTRPARGEPLAGLLSHHSPLVNPSLTPYRYDPDQAQALLAEAGYEPADIAFVLDSFEEDAAYAEAVAIELRRLGMDVAVQTWDAATLSPLLLAGQRAAYLGGWDDLVFDRTAIFAAKWHTGGRGNFSGYSNPRVDELIEAGETEIDEIERHVIYSEVQRILWEDVPAVFLFQPMFIDSCSIRARNWMPMTNGRISLRDVWLADENGGGP
jgi:peptide/nickel transport system substrate-binding protein